MLLLLLFQVLNQGRGVCHRPSSRTRSEGSLWTVVVVVVVSGVEPGSGVRHCPSPRTRSEGRLWTVVVVVVSGVEPRAGRSPPSISPYPV